MSKSSILTVAEDGKCGSNYGECEDGLHCKLAEEGNHGKCRKGKVLSVSKLACFESPILVTGIILIAI